jgi:hypothetical protein
MKRTTSRFPREFAQQILLKARVARLGFRLPGQSRRPRASARLLHLWHPLPKYPNIRDSRHQIPKSLLISLQIVLLLHPTVLLKVTYKNNPIGENQMYAQSRFLLIVIFGILVILSTSALASSYRYIDENGDAVISQQPPAEQSYAVIGDNGDQLWYVSNTPLPVSHWHPFWMEPNARYEEYDPFGLPEVRQRRPIVTIEEVGAEDPS